MSSILKALEKVDESQRQRRSAGTGGLGRGRGSRPAWLAPVWALSGAAVAALATYALMGGFTRPTPVAEKTERPAVAETPQQVQRQVAVPVSQPAAQATATPAQPAAKTAMKAVAQSASPAVTTRQVVAKTAAMPVGTKQPAAVKTAQPASNAALQPAPVEAATDAAVVPEPEPQKSRPAIRVSGIAWQNSSEASFAMVNGRALRQGAVVEGYKLEQIYEDSVRFSNSKGNSLVVPLGAGDE